MRRTPLLALFVIVFGCSEQALLTEPRSGSEPSYAIADADRGYKAGFYWLPPMVATPSYDGTFDAELAPTVEICELAESACGSVLATFTMETGPGSETVRLDVANEHYMVNWHTDQFALNTTAIYRITVRAGDNVLLGYADVQPVSTGKDMKNVDTDEYIALVDGRTLPIKVRIETNIVGSVIVEPAEATANSGATQQFIAMLADLHGNAMSAPVTWASSVTGVATVDNSGLATAVGDGESIMTATSEQITGSATLTVVGGVISITAGFIHSCALDAAGKAYCWGFGGFGQLGSGSTANQLLPVAVAGGHTFATISTGSVHTCAVTTTGEGYCWGRGTGGQLGDGSISNQLIPVPVSGAHTFASISVGGDYACGVTTAGRGYCWGVGFSGRLGNGSTAIRFVPVEVSGGHTFASINAGNAHACAVTTAGVGYCWGTGGSGELGNGSTANRFVPVAISGGHTFDSIDPGANYTCGVTTTREGYCWGLGINGRLGIGSSTLFQLVPMMVSGEHSFASISAGGAHTCSVTTAGAAYCWGLGANGRLGNGSTANQLVPMAVSGGHNFATIDAGTGHTCGVTVVGVAYCWGVGGDGRLGNGSTVDQLVPVAIAPLP